MGSSQRSDFLAAQNDTLGNTGRVCYVRLRQKRGLLERGWWGNNTGVIIRTSSLNISPKTSEGVLEGGIVMLQNYMLMIL